MLAEQVSRTHSPDAQREYAAQSLMSGCIAQKLAAGRAMLDKQQAFICASLRNFGQIVLTSCMAEEFQQLRKEAGGEPDDEGYRRVFGLTPLELGHQLLDAANLPDEILCTLRAIPPEAFGVLEQKPEDQMRALTEFAGELAALTLDPRSDPSDFPAKSQALARRYETALPGLHEEIHPLMDAASEQMGLIIRTFRIKSLPVRVTTRLTRCRNMVDPNRPEVAAPPAPATTATGAGTNPATIVKAPAAAAAPSSQSAVPMLNASKPPHEVVIPSAPAVRSLPTYDWDQGVNSFAGILRQPGTSRKEIHTALLESVRNGLGATDCLLFIAPPASRSFPLVNGIGALYRDLNVGPDLSIATGERTVLGVCLSRNENIMIHHAHENKIQAYLPPWLKSQTKVGSFVLLPLGDGPRVGGVLIAGWPEARQIVLPPECVKSVRTMLALACRVATRMAA